MFRLRIALGVASSLVAMAALTIVFSGTGEAQGSVKATSVVVTNTPLPVIGNVAATVSGNVNATVINPANSPVLIRDVDGKELWQENYHVIYPDGSPGGYFAFPTVPAGKALVVEHINIFVGFNPGQSVALQLYSAFTFSPFSPGLDIEDLVPQPIPEGAVANSATKFYVRAGASLLVSLQRTSSSGEASVRARATGYLVNYP